MNYVGRIVLTDGYLPDAQNLDQLTLKPYSSAPDTNSERLIAQYVQHELGSTLPENSKQTIETAVCMIAPLPPAPRSPKTPSAALPLDSWFAGEGDRYRLMLYAMRNPTASKAWPNHLAIKPRLRMTPRQGPYRGLKQATQATLDELADIAAGSIGVWKETIAGWGYQTFFSD